MIVTAVQGDAAVQRLALSPHSKKVLSLNSLAVRGFSVWSVHILPMFLWFSLTVLRRFECIWGNW